MLDTRFKQYTLPPFAQDFINHLAVTNKSKSTQLAYSYELYLLFLYLCKSMHGFPSSPADIELNLMETIGHRHIPLWESSPQSSCIPNITL